jgi:hypothetical protein
VPDVLGSHLLGQAGKSFFRLYPRGCRRVDFDDAFIYREMAAPVHKRRIEMQQLLRAEALEVFDLWKNKPDKTLY